MTQTKHSALTAPKEEADALMVSPDPIERMVIRVPRSLKGRLRAIAWDSKTTVERLAAGALEEFAARERNGAAA